MASAVLVVSDDGRLPGAWRRAVEASGTKLSRDGRNEFIHRERFDDIGCVLIDARTDAEVGLTVLRRLRTADARHLKAIVIAATPNVPFAVQAAKAGAFEVLAAPLDPDELRDCVREALALQEPPTKSLPAKVPTQQAAAAYASLTRRQREILRRILDGQPNKVIAAELGISKRTAENHRAMVMKKLGASSISDVIQIALVAVAGD